MAMEVECAGRESVSAMLAMTSSDEDELLSPKQKRASQKKTRILSDDEDDVASSNIADHSDKSPTKSASDSDELEDIGSTKKRRSRLVVTHSTSEDSVDEEKTQHEGDSKKDFGLRKIQKKSFDKLKKKNKAVSAENSSDEEEAMNKSVLSDEEEIALSQNKTLGNLRAEFGAESSEEDEQKGRSSSLSNRSQKSNKSDDAAITKGKKKPAPKRKSAVACRTAMEKERQKMVSENQRMVRESMASLPYHKPKQRSLKEFLSARPRASLELKGAKPTNVDINVIEKELQETEKLAVEFYKQESEEEEDRYTPPPVAETHELLNNDNILEKEEDDSNKVDNPEVNVAKKALDFDELEEKLTAVLEEQNTEAATENTTPMEEVTSVLDDIKESAEVENENSVVDPAPALVDVIKPQETVQIEPDVDISKDDNPPGKLSLTERLSSETADACLTPSDAATEPVFAVPAPPNEGSKNGVQDSLEEDFHLYLEDSEDPSEVLKDEAQKFDLQKIFEKNVSSDEEEKVEKSPVKILTSRAQLLEKLKHSRPVKLQGSSSDIIDLNNPDETLPNGVEQLMQRFIRHASAGKKQASFNPKQEGILNMIKAGEKIDDRADLTTRPGIKMSRFKTELQESIAKQRVQEFNQRQKEYKMYEDETDELLGNDFDEEADEVSKKVDDMDEFDPHLANETESEPEPDDDVVKPEKPRVKSAFVEEEADESEPENADELKEDVEDEEDPEADDCDGDDEIEEDDDDDDDMDCDESDIEAEDDLNKLTPSGKKNYSRIVRIDDSDDDENEKDSNSANTESCLQGENNDKLDQSFASNLNNSANLSILESPAASANAASNFSSSSKHDLKIMGDMYGPTQPSKYKAMPSGITQLLNDGNGDCLSSNVDETQDEDCATKDNSADLALPLKLDLEEPTQKDNLADLCSGQFLTLPQTQAESAPTGLKDLIEENSSQFADIADLCSGQFVTQANTEKTQNIEELCSEKSETQAEEVPKNFDMLVGDKAETQTQDLAALCSGNFITQPNGTTQIPDTTDNKADSPLPDEEDGLGQKLIISSDEEGDNKENSQSQEKKKKRKKKRKLDFSDDEDEEEIVEDEAEEAESEIEDEEEDFNLVDYDSEENEVKISYQPGQQKKPKATRFFEAEAELSGSDWDSADEDERGLDDLEEELGDRDRIDEDDVQQELKKIHARRMLDEDKRDIRLFQEAFLEDGDLHSEGGGRQRLFRWKNTDDGELQGGCNPNLSGDEGVNDDEEDDQAWRVMRLERENWLKEHGAKEMASDTKDENSQLLCLGKNLLAKMNGAKLKPTPEPNPALKKTIIPIPVKSPGKAILQSLQGKSGSFFSRTKISLTKVVAITGGDTDGIVSNKSKRNFVFSTISPSSVKGPDSEPLDESFEEPSPKPTKAKKRQAATNVAAASNPRAKKHKVSSSIFKLF